MEASSRFIEGLANTRVLAQIHKELKAEQDIFISVRTRISITVMMMIVTLCLTNRSHYIVGSSTILIQASGSGCGDIGILAPSGLSDRHRHRGHW
jgi:hypothetical protein